jgi:uncharacterized protein GlcG (DUF336 family)|tara:strand:+ start:236 stop:736 length:501 start_codon:yes stop_codon:yes gene_type:complete
MKSKFWLPIIILILFSSTAKADDETFVTFKSLNLETAMELANGTLLECRKRGFQISVAVVDRSGILQILLRDRFAGPHTPETARRKAWTAISFRTDTQQLAELTQPGELVSGTRQIDGALMLGGGVQILSAGSIVGGVGVSGAPGGDSDDACARAGILAIEGKLAF